MKKIFFILLLSISAINAENVDTQPTQSILAPEKIMPSFYNRSKGIITSAGKKTGTVFNFTVDKADKILSKKFLIASAMILAPAIYAYSKFINPKHAKIILEETSKIIAQKTTDVVAATTKEAIKGIGKSALENKRTIGLYYLAMNAIPFLVWISSKILSPTLERMGKSLGTTIIKKPLSTLDIPTIAAKVANLIIGNNIPLTP